MSEPPSRNLALDSLRGASVLLMCLSGVVPFGSLPSWMYHAQLPPPEHRLRPDVPGITWVDLVFPLFLFAMGAAIPLALSARLQRGAAVTSLAGAALRRGLVLAGFAFYAQAVQPYLLSVSPGPREWWLALLGFVLPIPVLARLPDTWSRGARLATRAIGAVGCAALLASLRYPDGSGFRLTRVDVILLVLANVVVTASWIWLATRTRPFARAGVLLAVATLCAGVLHGGWGAALPDSPAPWLARLEFQKYLVVVLPGTFAGDVLRAHASSRTSAGWRSVVAAGGLLAGIGCSIAGAHQRDPMLVGVGFLSPLAALGVARRVEDGGPWARIGVLGLTLLAAGAVLDPLEGGVRKDPANLSYVLATAGLSALALSSLGLLEGWRPARAPLVACGDVGRNPMLAYLAIRNVLAPAWSLSGLGALLAGALATPWLGVLHAALKTAALAAFSVLCTRARLVWRS